ncbi:hypothetical protein [Microbulbifer pacificus]|uniref:hypothetical protein n=1 Tax=Microbulbifer pacificus TaxID=407164 RepID=UPI000CF3DC41|nr:hypothetical protein [Microbulbifer pacificus]
MKKIYTIFLVVLFVSACISSQKVSDNLTQGGPPRVQPEKKKESIFFETYKTDTEKSFKVEVEGISGSLMMTVKSRGFNFNETHRFEGIDPIESIFQNDLDRDGFQEIYITTRSESSAASSMIYGVASNKDRSTSRIFLAELARGEVMGEGFIGNNRFNLENGVLIETYGQPDNEKRIKYSLVKREAGFTLIPMEI